MKISAGKTAPLFVSAIDGIAEISGRTDLIKSFGHYFAAMGVCYQFANDIQNIIGTDGAASPSSDLKRRAPNAVILDFRSALEIQELMLFDDWLAGKSKIKANHWQKKLIDSGAIVEAADEMNKLLIEAEGYLLFWADGEDVADHTNFKLSASGESIGIFNSELNVIDSITYLEQRSDISFGRNNDQWVFYESPTPGAQNGMKFYFDYVLSVPSFSKLGGLMRWPQVIELSSDSGGDIRYTLDGSCPNERSGLYKATIIFQENTKSIF